MVDGEHQFTVCFIGYATPGCISSPDNIIGCTRRDDVDFTGS